MNRTRPLPCHFWPTNGHPFAQKTNPKVEFAQRRCHSFLSIQARDCVGSFVFQSHNLLKSSSLGAPDLCINKYRHNTSYMVFIWFTSAGLNNFRPIINPSRLSLYSCLYWEGRNPTNCRHPEIMWPFVVWRNPSSWLEAPFNHWLWLSISFLRNPIYVSLLRAASVELNVMAFSLKSRVCNLYVRPTFPSFARMKRGKSVALLTFDVRTRRFPRRFVHIKTCEA